MWMFNFGETALGLPKGLGPCCLTILPSIGPMNLNIVELYLDPDPKKLVKHTQ